MCIRDRISGVTNWGFYVELPNTVEGLVRVNELRDDYYVFDEERYQLIGETSRHTYKLGQSIRIQVLACDRLLKTIDFIPAKRFDAVSYTHLDVYKRQAQIRDRRHAPSLRERHEIS